MKLSDIKRFCTECNQEIQLSVFQKTGLMGLHDQYVHVRDRCEECIRKENLKRMESEEDPDDITGTPI